MKIAYWGMVHGQARITSNMLAVAVVSTILSDYRMLITGTHFTLNNLEGPLIGYQSIKHKDEFFRDVGIDALIRSLKSAPLDEETIENCCFSLLNNRLSLLPGTMKNNKDYFHEDMEKLVINMLRYIEVFHDLVFIDTNPGMNDLTRKVIHEADLLVVNLNQNLNMLNHVLKEPLFEDKKTFYLIGNYDKASKYNIYNLRRMYKKLNRKNSSVIPYNTEFQDAISDGELIDFVKRNLQCGREDKNYYFINQLRQASIKILDLVGLEWRKDI